MDTICSGRFGREGPSIQLGAMAGKGFARLTKQTRTEEKLLITCGASAGLAAAFNAPLAGALFALEEVHKSFSVEVLLSSMASSITADFISRNVFGLKPVFDFSGAIAIPLSHFWIVMLVGVFAGLVGVLYNRCTDWVQGLYEKIPSRYLRTLIPFALAGIFAFACPAVLGGGNHLIMQIADGMPLLLLLGVFGLKFCFSITSFGSGVPGGIFLPLLVLGSMCGGIFHGAAAAVGMELNLQALLILGMAASFAAIVTALPAKAVSSGRHWAYGRRANGALDQSACGLQWMGLHRGSIFLLKRKGCFPPQAGEFLQRRKQPNGTHPLWSVFELRMRAAS